MTGSFIIHTPSTTNEFQSSFINQLLHFFFIVVWLILPPFEKEWWFNVNESFCRIFQQRCDHWVQNQLNIRLLVILLRAIVILINCFQPANIVVRMCHDVNIQHVWLWHRTTLLNWKKQIKRFLKWFDSDSDSYLIEIKLTINSLHIHIFSLPYLVFLSLIQHRFWCIQWIGQKTTSTTASFCYTFTRLQFNSRTVRSIDRSIYLYIAKYFDRQQNTCFGISLSTFEPI